MSTLNEHIVRLSIQMDRSPRDEEVFVSARTALQSGGREAIQAVQDFIKTHRGGVNNLKFGNAIFVDLSAANVQIGGAVALALCGEGAKEALQNLILAETVPLVRTRMVKEVIRLDTDWIPAMLMGLSGQVDEFTAGFIASIITETANPTESDSVTVPSGIEIWIQQLTDPEQCMSALNNLTKNTTLMELNQDQAYSQKAAQGAVSLMEALDDLEYQVKAAQLAYRYTPDFDTWLEILTWCEERFGDPSLPLATRLNILTILEDKLDRHEFKAEALEWLKMTLTNFFETNDIARLDAAAGRALRSNNLPLPDRRKIRPTRDLEQVTGTCAECKRDVTPTERVTRAKETFCSLECAQRYLMRTYGTLDPRYW